MAIVEAGDFRFQYMVASLSVTPVMVDSGLFGYKNSQTLPGWIMPDRRGGAFGREIERHDTSRELQPDPLLVALGYLTAHEGGPLMTERDFILGYLLAIAQKMGGKRFA